MACGRARIATAGFRRSRSRIVHLDVYESAGYAGYDVGQTGIEAWNRSANSAAGRFLHWAAGAMDGMVPKVRFEGISILAYCTLL